MHVPSWMYNPKSRLRLCLGQCMSAEPYLGGFSPVLMMGTVLQPWLGWLAGCVCYSLAGWLCALQPS